MPIVQDLSSVSIGVTDTTRKPLMGKDVYAYLDDLIICSNIGENHLANLEAVLFKLKVSVAWKPL